MLRETEKELLRRVSDIWLSMLNLNLRRIYIMDIIKTAHDLGFVLVAIVIVMAPHAIYTYRALRDEPQPTEQ